MPKIPQIGPEEINEVRHASQAMSLPHAGLFGLLFFDAANELDNEVFRAVQRMSRGARSFTARSHYDARAHHRVEARRARFVTEVGPLPAAAERVLAVVDRDIDWLQKQPAVGELPPEEAVSRLVRHTETLYRDLMRAGEAATGQMAAATS